MLKNLSVNLILVLAMAGTGPVLAQSDPTPHQVYEAAQAGHLEQAQQMIAQVLRDRPKSAQAHFVAAELYARAGNASQARQELQTAETLQPGLSFETPAHVQALQRQISQESSARTAQPYAYAPARPTSSISWGAIILLFAGIALVWAIVRRRTQPAVYSQYPNGSPYPPGNPGYGQPYGGAPGYGGPGMGSGIAGGLASGLAVGAGVVAGEELAHHFLDGNRNGGVIPEARADEPPQNGDMGGSDFGVSDPSSWGDSGGSFGGGDSGGGDSGGGGGDWT